MHYVIGAAALGMASYATVSPPSVQHEAAIHEIQKPSKFDWASLTPAEVSDLGDALKDGKNHKVTVFCRDATCHDLQLGLDDAFQVANWNESIETLPVDSEEDRGIFVGPPGPEADFVRAQLEKITGLNAKIVPIDGIEGVGIIIGKVSR